ncbi:hypothetical protein ACOMHN_001434 [Nucella lapillus]
MPTSGVNIPDECIHQFNAMKMQHNKDRKKDHGLICIAYRIANSYETFEIYKQFDKDASKTQDAQFEEIISELGDTKYEDSKGVPYVLVWDLKLPSKVQAVQGQAEAPQEVNTLFIMSLCLEEEVSLKSKMMFASSKASLKQQLPGVTYHLDVMCREDAKYSSVLSALKNSKKMS